MRYGEGMTGMGDAKFVGVDGCPAGWFSVALGEGAFHAMKVFSTFPDLVRYYHDAALILVDIPIGLKEDGLEERRCDKAARHILGRRGSSVFPAPVRQVLTESTYEAASRTNRRVRGKKISKQTWAIVPKITDVDHLLADVPFARGHVREIHPEVLFWALNGRKAMRFNKKKRPGIEERMAVLGRYEQRTQVIHDDVMANYFRKVVGRDDVLDALAAAVTARLGYPDKLATLPENPPRDARGLPMEMVFYNPRHA